MAEYIEREAVMQEFADFVKRSNNSYFVSPPTWNQAVQIVEDIHAADVVERKKGKWKQGYCSECGYNWGKDAPIASVPNFCPDCGADMREKS